MITDKWFQELKELTTRIRSTKMDAVFFDHGWDECADIIKNYVDKKCAESADQARKEAADRAKEKCRPFMTSAELTMLESAIINHTVKEGKTDAEKLAIAFDALFNIAANVKLPRAVARRALMEIQE